MVRIDKFPMGDWLDNIGKIGDALVGAGSQVPVVGEVPKAAGQGMRDAANARYDPMDALSSKQTPQMLTELAPSSTPALVFGAGVAYKDGYVYLLGGRAGGGLLTSKIHRTEYRTSAAADVIPSVVQARSAALPDGQSAVQSPSERCGIAHWTHYAYAPRSM